MMHYILFSLMLQPGLLLLNLLTVFPLIIKREGLELSVLVRNAV